METKSLSANEIMRMIDEIDISEYPLYSELLLKDERKTVQKIGKKLGSLYKAFHKEQIRIEKMKSFENQLFASGYDYIAGVDEAGRGPLAGPVVAAAVILPKECKILGINDSKKLSEKKREELALAIQNHALSIGIGVVDCETIDKINILNATKMAMIKAIGSLNQKPDHILIDALTLNEIGVDQTPIIKGDQRSISIAAASIIAKTTRDRIMYQYHEMYPQYDFHQNKGYGTQKHYEGIKKYGICPLHRKSFLKNYY